jgi:hypothetical protein
MLFKKNIQNQDVTFLKSEKFDSVFDIGQPRRKFLKYIILTSLGVTGVAVTESVLHKPGFAQINRQDKWRWCRKCQALSFADGPSLGACPAGGVHDHQGSYNYILIYNSPILQGQPNWQDKWGWCNKCQTLAFAGGNLGICAGGGVHNHQGSYNYFLRHDDPNYPGQGRWHWCRKCQELTYASLGNCPAGGSHDHTGSFNYTLQYL